MIDIPAAGIGFLYLHSAFLSKLNYSEKQTNVGVFLYRLNYTFRLFLFRIYVYFSSVQEGFLRINGCEGDLLYMIKGLWFTVIFIIKGFDFELKF